MCSDLYVFLLYVYTHFFNKKVVYKKAITEPMVVGYRSFLDDVKYVSVILIDILIHIRDRDVLLLVIIHVSIS